MLRITVTRLTGDKAVFNNGKDEIIATHPGNYLLYGDVPHEVKCKVKPEDAMCEYKVEPA